MDWITLLFWLMFLTRMVHNNPTTTEFNGVLFSTETTVSRTMQNNPTRESVVLEPTEATQANTKNTIDLLQNQLNQILVQFCASEIDRNKTASAILKFGQLADAKSSINDVVQFYVEHYEESFDNLLLFINNISSLELQQIAYNTLVEAVHSNKISVINLLSFENFMQRKFESINEGIERNIYEEILLTMGNHIKEVIVRTDLKRVIAFINNTANPDRILELIPIIVQGIDLNNFTDMNKIFEFCQELPRNNQLKLISKVLSEMREKDQYQHVLHVICQIKLLKTSIITDGDDEWMTTDICLLSTIESQVPSQLQNLLGGDDDSWRIENLLGKFLYFRSTPKYQKYLLYLYAYTSPHIWLFECQSYNSVAIRSDRYYLSVDYCFHNDSFPVVKRRDNEVLTHSNWYFLMANDLNHVQIKNIHTNELLISDDVSEMGDDGNSRTRLSLSPKCSDCESSQWLLKSERKCNQDVYSRCPKDD